MGTMRIMDKDHGDLKVIWDKKIKPEVEAAKEQFNALMKKGYKAFMVEKSEKGKELKEFDADVEMMILSPAPVKGCIQRLLGPYCP
jgi:hypothetical protein